MTTGPAEPTGPFLSLRHLVKVYGTAPAVDGISLDVARGELLALLGPSGCGKTTTLQMIAGFVQPTSGEIVLDGGRIDTEPPARRDIGVVFQSYALFPHMTVTENVEFGLRMRRLPEAERRRRVAEILKLVRLDGFEERFPKQLSGGQQQRVALARALVIRPRLLLLDEPMSNLDAKLREEMQIEIRQIQRHVGTTMILVTHDQSEALALADRVAVMQAGRIVQIATPHHGYENPGSEFVADFLGRANLLTVEVIAGNAGATRIDLAGHLVDVAVPTPSGAGRLRIAIRPEKLRFAEAGIPGTVVARIFHGPVWTCAVETRAGRLLVSAINDGAEAPSEGADVHLAVDPERIVILGGVDG